MHAGKQAACVQVSGKHAASMQAGMSCTQAGMQCAIGSVLLRCCEKCSPFALTLRVSYAQASFRSFGFGLRGRGLLSLRASSS
ncbi:unnamed protein product [Diatraea saccharalis]|uniref:Uncharacterized protein n=1 Tax=Diatraea saccharalis TaxID=40085 RepID=A0A9N9RFY4_9NEOP|nr:unnamed protein product [Diatraea saccharalis]